MSGSKPLLEPALRTLAHEIEAYDGCVEAGLSAFANASSWHGDEPTLVSLLAPHADPAPSLAHDLRGAPYLCDTQGTELQSLLLSLSDERDTRVAAWAQVRGDAPLKGLGVDLCSAARFERHPKWAQLLLTDHERALAPTLWPDDPNLAYATLFAAKEASFKATSAPLRRWYEDHQEQLRFEVRHFVMDEPYLERGTGRDAAAQRALDAMGIARMTLHCTRVGGRALVVACALAL